MSQSLLDADAIRDRNGIGTDGRMYFDKMLEWTHLQLLEWARGERVAGSAALEGVRAIRQLLTDLPDEIEIAVHKAVQEAKKRPLDAVAAAASAETPDWPPIRVHDPILLGVHRSITLPNALLPSLTTYIPRRHDQQLRKALRSATGAGGQPVFTAVVGGSSTGKTRAMLEAVAVVLPDWPLFHPTDADQLVDLLERGMPPFCVVWIDGLLGYLAHAQAGATAAKILYNLLTTSGVRPFVGISSIWPSELRRLMSRPDLTTAAADELPYAAAVTRLIETVQHRGWLVRTPDDFTASELASARAAGDPRLRAAAAAASDRRLTQILAGGPQLVQRMYPDERSFSTISNPFSASARSVVFAAAELRRIGHPNPLPQWAVLKSAHDYLPDDWRHRLAPEWTETGLSEATNDAILDLDQRLDIARAGIPALSPHYNGATLVGYDLHDYLTHDHLIRHRHAPTAAGLWEVLKRHTGRLDPGIATTLGRSARDRGLLRVAVQLLEASASEQTAGSWSELGDVLGQLGDVARLRELEDCGISSAHLTLIRTLRRAGDVSALETMTNSGDQYACEQLTELLKERGDLDSLKRLGARWLVPPMLALIAQWDADGDLESLRAVPLRHDWQVRMRVTQSLARHGDVDGLMKLCNQGDHWAASGVADAFRQRGNLSGLRDWVNKQGGDGLIQLAEALVEHGKLDELRSRKDIFSRMWLAQELANRGELSELQQLADAKDPAAIVRLREVHARSDLTALRMRVITGDEVEAQWLAEELRDAGNLQALFELAMEGQWQPTRILVSWLVDNQDVLSLEALANAGIDHARRCLVELLGSQGNRDALERRAQGGDRHAHFRLAKLLASDADENSLVRQVFSAAPGAAELLIELMRLRMNESCPLELSVDGEPVLLTSGGL
jgi:hypothetical protein